MKTLPKQTLLFTEEESTSLREDFLVRMQASLNKTEASEGFKEVGRDWLQKCSERLKKSSRATLLPKTWRIFYKSTEAETLPTSSVNWPEWGIMQNGEYVERANKVRRTTGQGFIWLLTPTASESNREKLSYPMFKKRLNRSPGGLSEQLFRLFGPVGGIVNPQLYAWMMGFPEAWLENTLKDTETQ